MLVLWMLVACKGELVGEWEGECEIFSESGIWRADISFDLDRQRGRKATGEGVLAFDTVDLAEYDFEGPATGSLDGDDVELRLDAVAGGYLVVLRGEGRVSGDDIDGDCEIDYVGDEVGDLELDR